MSVKRLTIHQYVDDDYYSHSEKVTDEDSKELYHVWDLTDCPEDAIIGRKLFSARSWVDAVEYGMSLAEQGFTSIEVETIEEEEEDW